MAFRLKSRFWRRRHVIISAVGLALLILFALNALSETKDNSNQNNNNNNNDVIINRRQRQQREQQFERDFKENQKNNLKQQLNSINSIPPLMRVVHIDLKGAPPKPQFFSQLFPLVKNLGANAILLEYEDMFPFEAILSPIKAYNAYTKEEVNQILFEAKQNQLEVIPLIQTFGHLEFALKLEPFSHLREVPSMPQAICPLNNDSWPVIKAMIDQVMSIHTNVKYLHIGCDEVYHIGLCSKCRLQERDHLFLTHVYRVSQYVVNNYKVIPIIWDDMLRQLSLEAIKESRIAEIGVEPMIWTYVRDIYRFIPESQFLAYSQIFPNVWAASAFKGAFGETLTVPNIRMHLENNIAWISTIKEQKKNFKSFRGICITGWQRYDHLANLCELLPSSIPSLALNLLTLSYGEFKANQIFPLFDRYLRCSQHSQQSQQYSDTETERILQQIDESDPNLFQRAESCQFAGSDIYRLMKTHLETQKQVNDYLYDVTQHKAWLTLYNVRHNISSPYRVDEALQEFSSVNYGLSSLIRTAKEALSQVYDRFTVEEWIEQNIYPLILKMDKLLKDSEDLKRSRVWPKRPLEAPPDLKRRLDSL